jgi:hypothetical protein
MHSFNRRAASTCERCSGFRNSSSNISPGCVGGRWVGRRDAPQAGTTWQDLRADYHGIAPVTDHAVRPLTFGEWDVNWLDEGLARIAERPSQGRETAAARPWWTALFRRS